MASDSEELAAEEARWRDGGALLKLELDIAEVQCQEGAAEIKRIFEQGGFARGCLGSGEANRSGIKRNIITKSDTLAL